MVLAELALGRYPYPCQSFIEAASMITAGPPPLPGLSPQLRQFLESCMSPEHGRPSAIGLMAHPWVLAHLRYQPTLKAFIKSI